MIVASTIVPAPSFRPRPYSAWPTAAKNSCSLNLCVSSRRRNFSSIVPSGTRSRPRSMPTKRRSRAVQQRFFAGLIGQFEPVLHEVHALQPHRRAPVARLRVARLDHRSTAAATARSLPSSPGTHRAWWGGGIARIQRPDRLPQQGSVASSDHNAIESPAVDLFSVARTPVAL